MEPFRASKHEATDIEYDRVYDKSESRNGLYHNAQIEYVHKITK